VHSVLKHNSIKKQRVTFKPYFNAFLYISHLKMKGQRFPSLFSPRGKHCRVTPQHK